MREFPRPQRPWDRTPVGEREYFHILGPGLVAVLPPRPPGEGGTEWAPPTGGSWVHVGPTSILGFTGKAEVGQGTRAALSLIVAEELRVPFSMVEMVMADTDLCPWDMGTFGSRSMPDASQALARAAAGARDALLAIASEALGVPRADLEARDGMVRARGSSRGTTFGDLVRGLRRVETVPAGVVLTGPADWERAGSPVTDSGGEEVVTGGRQYVSDLVRPGMQHGLVVHPPTLGATLESLDVTATERRPGVTVVRSGEFVGVAAPTRREVRAALQDIRASWKERPQPDHADLESFLRSHPFAGDSWDTDEHVIGDVDAALSGAAAVVRTTYTTAFVAHVPLETHCAVAEWTGPRLTVWVGSQTPFRLRDAVSKALQTAPEDVRVIVPPTGSGFGGKHGADIAIAAARLSRAAGHPVRVAYTREEEFRYGYLRPMAIIDVRAGADAGGRLVAWSFHNVNAGAAALLAPYRIPNQKVDNELSQSPLAQGSYRSLAAATNNFARESAIDELASQLRVDPLVFRDSNLEDARLRTALGRAGEKAGWVQRVRQRGRGFGVAVGLEKNSRVATVAEVTVHPDRSLRVDRLVTAFEAGAIVHPENLRNQVEGALVMALGGALFEEVQVDRGVIKNARLGAYRVPRFSDVPTIEVELIDRRDLPPSGAGETPMIAVAPAVANAIHNATGVRLRSLPLVPSGKVPLAGEPDRHG